MKFTTESVLALLLALPIMYGFACRAKVLAFGKTKPIPTLFHMAGGLQTLATPALALASGTVSVSEWLGLAMCGLWLVLSYYSWSGPTAPEHVQTRPAPLEVMEGRR